MPEFYIEALKDHRTCFKCKRTGKKSLLTCDRCHAITYCGVECQKEDRARHKWNCSHSTGRSVACQVKPRNFGKN